MINALFSSRHGGAKCFLFEGVEFGWQAVIDMYHRECQRRNNGLARMVPRLREIHVMRDAWTKLNVHPAKIMQVCLYTVSCMYVHILVLETTQWSFIKMLVFL
jgi:hypothetical protein